jgi:hypothetical protein
MIENRRDISTGRNDTQSHSSSAESKLPRSLSQAAGSSIEPQAGGDVIEGNVSFVNANEALPTSTSTESKCPFALVVSCKHTSKEDLFRELGLTRQRKFSNLYSDFDDQYIYGVSESPQLGEMRAPSSRMSDVYTDPDLDDDQLASIIESTMTRESKKAVLISLSSNVYLKNISTAPLSVLHGDRQLSQPIESDDSELHPLPLDVLSYGHMRLLRMWGPEELEANNIHLTIKLEALDPFIPNFLRRSADFDRQSIILRMDNSRQSLNKAAANREGMENSVSLNTMLSMGDLHAARTNDDADSISNSIESDRMSRIRGKAMLRGINDYQEATKVK